MRRARTSCASFALAAALALCGAAWTAQAAGAPQRVEAAAARAETPAELAWPARRFAPCAAFDDARGALYVFGGRGEGGGAHFADAWRIRVRSPAPRWRLVLGGDAPKAPPPLRSCAAAWDSHAGRMLMFGGWNGVTPTNGVWALTPGRSPRWERLCDATSCGTPPSARRAAGAVYDPVGRRLLVFGGLDGAFRNDLWALSLDVPARWTRLPANGPQPPARASHALAYDAGRRLVWLVGGTTSGADLGDTLTLDPATASWREVRATGPARSGAVLAYDDAADRLMLHGGLDSTTGRVLRDTWTLDDLATAPGWTQVRPAGEEPQRRFAGVGAFDSRLRRMLVFGGGVGLTALKDLAALDLRRRDGLSWGPVAPRTPLTGRDQVAVGFTPRTGSLFAFGGFGSGAFPGRLDAGTHLADTWRLRGGRLGDVTPPMGARAPLHREAAAVATDPSRERTFMIGGLEGDDELADAWVADLTGPGAPRWRQLCSPTSCGAGPAARWGAHAAYDPARNRVVVLGGRRTDGTSFNDVWALSLGRSPRWSRLEVAGEPPAPRWGGAAGYDPVRRRIVLAGGQTGSDPNAIAHNDAWALSLRGPGPAWRRLAPAGGAPTPRRSPAYAMRVHGRAVELLMAGGLNAGTGAHFNDVWSLTLGGGRAAWSELATSDCAAAAAPACRRSAGGAYDPRGDRLLTVFGRDAQRFYADAWSFDLGRRRWEALTAGRAVTAAAARIPRDGARRARLAAIDRRRDAPKAPPPSRAAGLRGGALVP